MIIALVVTFVLVLMYKKPLPSQEYLCSLFDYNPETGIVTEKTQRSRRTKVGDVVKCQNAQGYIVTTIDGVLYSLHRLIYKMMTDSEPNIIDHKNNIRNDNKWENIRSVDFKENSHNRIDLKFLDMSEDAMNQRRLEYMSDYNKEYYKRVTKPKRQSKKK